MLVIGLCDEDGYALYAIDIKYRTLADAIEYIKNALKSWKVQSTRSRIGGIAMFNIIKDPCGLCSHKTVCSMKESYQSIVKFYPDKE